MKTRIITGACLVAVLAAVIGFSYLPPVLPIVSALLAVTAIYELLKCMGLHRHILLTAFVCALAAVLPIYTIWYADRGHCLALGVVLVVALIEVLFAYAVFGRGRIRFEEVAQVLTVFVYIVFGCTAWPLLRAMEYGKYLFVLVFVASWITDTFAYFTGYFLGRHKLIPEISPKKTVEGSVGGIVFCVLGFVLFGVIVHAIEPAASPNYIALIACGLISSVISQIGDLIASLIKREHGVKDYGRLFPGHGGVMDRFDSFFAVVPIVYAFCAVFRML